MHLTIQKFTHSYAYTTTVVLTAAYRNTVKDQKHLESVL